MDKQTDERFASVKYLNWLHELTHVGYDNDVMFCNDDSKLINELFLEELTAKEAFEEFKKRRKQQNTHWTND
jgi:hypothetical protein